MAFITVTETLFDDSFEIDMMWLTFMSDMGFGNYLLDSWVKIHSFL